jgi:hypothetical protein
MSVELSRERQYVRAASSQVAFEVAPGVVLRQARGVPVAVCDLVIGEGGFTDDFTETADAGGSPHSQLCSLDRGLLCPRGRRVRQTLQ